MPTTDQTLAFSRVLTPTAVKQCIGFMIGSALFAVGAGIAIWGNADQGTLANVLYFIGSWFFTAAGMVQPRIERGGDGARRLRTGQDVPG